MATGQYEQVLRQLDTRLAEGSASELTDGQLLERFATRAGDVAEHAFATLVERHRPLVMRVCRGVLFDRNDVEDPFQATFLVLVQKARSLWVSDSLGPWLHQVALRTALCAALGSGTPTTPRADYDLASWRTCFPARLCRPRPAQRRGSARLEHCLAAPSPSSPREYL